MEHFSIEGLGAFTGYESFRFMVYYLGIVLFFLVGFVILSFHSLSVLIAYSCFACGK